VLAVPMAPTDTIAQLRTEADDVVCLDRVFFGAIGFYYAEFWQVLDQTVIDMLKRSPPQPTVESKQSAPEPVNEGDHS